MLVIGLTGGIGSGKSAVSAQFARLGAPVIDADAIAREVVLPGQAALQEIAQAFGAEILDRRGHLDRTRLRRVVFADPAARRRLEAITHPRIRAAMRERMAQLTAPYCVLAIPLLLETGQQDIVDRVLVVDAPRELQIQRAISRDRLSQAEVEAIIDAQTDRATRLAAAHDVIVNDGSLGALRRRVEELHRYYLGLSSGGADCQASTPPGE